MYIEYFTTKEAYNLLSNYGDSELKDKVDAFINRFINYCAALPQDDLTKLQRNIDEYTSGPWTIRTSYPDDETFKGSNQFPKLRLEYHEGNSTIEMQFTIADRLDAFLSSTLLNNNVQLVKFTKSITESSPYKYNEDIDMFSVVKTGNNKKKYITSRGNLFGKNYQVVLERDADEAESEN